MYLSYYRTEARNALSWNWGKAILASLIAGIFGALVVSGSSGVSFNIDYDTLPYFPEPVRERILGVLSVMAVISLVMGVINFAIGGAVQLGYCKFLLNLQDNRPASLKDLFSEMDRWVDALVMNFLRSLFIALWTMLFIIPGIIATYRFAMAPFIMLEKPYLGPLEVLRESKEMMHGNKMDLFLLDLSFIGWALLCVLTLGIGYLWLVPYMNAAYASFYRFLNPLRQINS